METQLTNTAPKIKYLNLKWVVPFVFLVFKSLSHFNDKSYGWKFIEEIKIQFISWVDSVVSL